MDFKTAMKVSGSGLTAHRAWMNVTSANLANVNTTRTASGEPFKRLTVIYESTPVSDDPESAFDPIGEQEIQQVEVASIKPDQREFLKVYDPSHPDADENGIVSMPNVNVVEEMTHMITASRSYEANLAALSTAKQLALKALEIGK